MRTIKFRAKDYKGNFQFGSYYYGCMYPTSFNGHYVNDTQIDEKTLGQFTGLHDKNGKEIYEGDIIRMEEVVCPITWSDGCFMMITDENAGRSAAIQDRVKRFEVIGNIYEHPNLLK